jgi:hypothetical protein
LVQESLETPLRWDPKAEPFKPSALWTFQIPLILFILSNYILCGSRALPAISCASGADRRVCEKYTETLSGSATKPPL